MAFGRFGDSENCGVLMSEGCRETELSRPEKEWQITALAIGRAGLGSLRLDRQGRVCEANDYMCAVLGYSKDEILNLTVFDISPGLDPKKWPRRWAELRSMGSATFEAHFRTKAGEVIPVEISANVVEFEGHEFNFGLIREISDRKRAERERQITAHAIEHAGLGLIALDKEGRVREVNAYMCRLLGYSRDEMLALGAADFTVDLEPGSWPERWEELQAMGPVTLEREFRTREGRVFPVEIASSIVEFEGEYLDHGFIRDISDRKLAEKSLRERDDQLRQSQKMEAIGRLAGGIAHDFNNLLTAIIGYSDLLLANEEISDPWVREDLEEIRSAAKRAGGLTKQILAFSRRQTLKPQLVSINSVIEEMAPLLRRTLGEDVELSTSLDPDLGLVQVDTTQFTQVLMNLAVNARDAMPMGGGLTFKTENVRLHELSPNQDDGLEPGDYVLMSASDTGIGIEAEALPLLFEPFYTTKSPGEGTGLGLPTAYGIVKQSGGTISVESRPGEGTIFRVLLPRVNKDAYVGVGEKTSREDQGSSILQGARILLVEDEAAVRNLTGRILAGFGCTVLAAGDGPEALEILRTPGRTVDLLLTDVVLPGGIDGTEVARMARRIQEDIAVLFISGYTRSAFLERENAGTEVHYLEKPFSGEQLEYAVIGALSSSRGVG